MKIKSLHKVIPGVKLNVCAYARISNDKEELMTSLDEQISFYTSLILERPEWNFCGIYADKGISGTTIAERKQFLKMIDDAKNGFIDIILVKSISRFARNLIDLLTIVQELRKIGVEIYFEQQNMSSLDPTCDQMITLYAEFAEEEAKSMSLNVRWRNEKNKRDGVYYVKTTQMKGYRRNEDGELEIVEEDAYFIRKMFEMYLNGCSVRQIGDYFEEVGFKTVTGQSTWSTTTVRAMLNNEKYVGDCLIQKTYQTDYKDHRTHLNRGEVEMVLVQNGHPAIITRDVWNRTQNLMEQRRKQFKIKNRYDDASFHFQETRYARHVYCPYCGSNYQFKHLHYNGQKTKSYLTCASNGVRKKCNNDNIFTDILDTCIIKEVQYLKEHPAAIKEALISAYANPLSNALREEINSKEREIQALRTKLKRLETMNDDFAEALKSEIKDEIVSKTKSRMKLQSDLLTSDSAEIIANEFIAKLKKVPANPTSLDEFDFKGIFSRVIVKNKGFLYLVIGNSEVGDIKMNAKSLFNNNHKYMIRKTECEIKFGIIINNKA